MTSFLAVGLAYLTACIVSLSVGLAAWRHRPAPGALGLTVLSLAQAAWAGSFTVQWLVTDHSASLAWLAVRNIGLYATPIGILILTAGYVGKTAWLSRPRLVAISAPLVVIWFLQITDPWHGLYLGNAEPTMKMSGGGPLFQAVTAYSFVVILYGVSLLSSHLLHKPPYPRQTFILLVAVLLPIVDFVAQLAGVDPLPGVNTVPLTFMLSGALMWYALTRLGLFSLVPIARDQLIEHLQTGVIVLNSESRVIDINPAAMRLTGATGNVMGMRSDIAFPFQLKHILEMRQVLDSADEAEILAEFLPGVWVEAMAFVIRAQSGDRLVTVISLRDMSERIATERMQRDFVANVAHELQTPLTGLSLLAKTIPRAMREDPRQALEFVDRLGTEVDRLAGLTQELMTLARAEQYDAPDATDIAHVRHVVAEQVKAIDPLARSAGQTIETTIPSSVCARCSELDLGVIVGNLLRNAVRYSPAGSVVHVDAIVEPGDARLGSDVVVALTVSDQGEGIPYEDQERIFERFYRVDKARSRRTGGTGLGLSIVKQTTEKCGGSVSLSSTPGKGSSFTVRLPGPPPDQCCNRTHLIGEVRG